VSGEPNISFFVELALTGCVSKGWHFVTCYTPVPVANYREVMRPGAPHCCRARQVIRQVTCRASHEAPGYALAEIIR